jgi:hypothetical protein
VLEQLLKGIVDLKIAGMRRNNYATTKTGVSEIRSKADEVWEAIGWECPVDRTSVQALCQLHDVFVDEERRYMNDESHIHESRNGGKTKVSTFELTSDIEQWMDQQKVLKDEEDTINYTLCRQREVSVEEKQKQLDQRGPTCEVATSTIEPPTNLKKLLEKRAPQQQQEPP